VKFFADTVVKPLITRHGYRRLCEIGASYGETTDALLQLGSVSIDVVDPCLDADLGEKYRGDARVRVHPGFSLEVIPKLKGPFECILIDGDHNWYTVFNELKLIEERNLLQPGGTIFVHDVGWPYGRRDMYYQPELVPDAHRQPFKRAGLVYGQSALSDESDNNKHLANATHEGGPRNGVLTAIEDFMKQSQRRYQFRLIAEEYGLGIMFQPSGTWDALKFRMTG
jgi:hypothetical protein